MHDTSAVGGAIAKVIHDWPAMGSGGQLELEIRDATRADAAAVAHDASVFLADHGFSSTSFTVSTGDTHCDRCGELVISASPADPRCDQCEAPLPQVPGPAVVCREVSPCV